MNYFSSGSTPTTSSPSWSSTKRPSTTTAKVTRPTSTTTVTTMTTTKLTTSKPVVISGPTQKPCEHGQYYPYPNSCTSFLVCVNGDLVSQQCGPGLNWNTEKNMCDWAFKNPCIEKPHKNALLMEKDNVSNINKNKYKLINVQ